MNTEAEQQLLHNARNGNSEEVRQLLETMNKGEITFNINCKGWYLGRVKALVSRHHYRLFLMEPELIDIKGRAILVPSPNCKTLSWRRWDWVLHHFALNGWKRLVSCLTLLVSCNTLLLVYLSAAHILWRVFPDYGVLCFMWHFSPILLHDTWGSLGRRQVQFICAIYS